MCHNRDTHAWSEAAPSLPAAPSMLCAAANCCVSHSASFLAACASDWACKQRIVQTPHINDVAFDMLALGIAGNSVPNLTRKKVNLHQHLFQGCTVCGAGAACGPAGWLP